VRQRAEPLIERTRIVIWKNADREIVGRRPLAAEVTERTPIHFIAPHARAKKRPGERATYSPGVVLEMKIPQGIHGHERGLRPFQRRRTTTLSSLPCMRSVYLWT